MGRVTAAVNPTTGRMDYRGRAMNKAARVASKAHTGQVSIIGDVVCRSGKFDGTIRQSGCHLTQGPPASVDDPITAWHRYAKI
jgi:hypothetical protein